MKNALVGAGVGVLVSLLFFVAIAISSHHHAPVAVRASPSDGIFIYRPPGVRDYNVQFGDLVMHCHQDERNNTVCQ